MKAIQITIDESLLEELDRHPAVIRHGRSAVIRQAASEYLARSARAEIASQYAAGYLAYASIDEEFGEWSDEAVLQAE